MSHHGFPSSSAATTHLSRPMPPPPPPQGEFALRLVQVVNRHGERSPMVNPFRDFPFARGGKGLCTQQSFLSHLAPTSPLFRIVFKDRASPERLGSCTPGQLTDEGKASMFRLGAVLREAYGSFLAQVPRAPEVQIRSTEVPRAIESAQHLVEGLFPGWGPAQAGGAEAPPALDIEVREEKSETMYPNLGACARLRRDMKDLQAKVEKSQKAEAEALGVHLKEVLGAGSRHVSVHSIYDMIACSEAHGLELPEKADEALLAQTERMMVERWWMPFEESEELCRLGIGRLVQEITEKMAQKAESGSPLKFCLYSAHDSTIAPLLSTFRVFDKRWPPFSSNVIFELYERTGEGGGGGGGGGKEAAAAGKAEGHYVRMLYNGRELRIPGCQKTAVADGALCPLSTFLSVAQRYIPQDYEAECRAVS